MDEVIAEILETPTGHNDVMLLKAMKTEPISQRIRAQLTGSCRTNLGKPGTVSALLVIHADLYYNGTS